MRPRFFVFLFSLFLVFARWRLLHRGTLPWPRPPWDRTSLCWADRGTHIAATRTLLIGSTSVDVVVAVQRTEFSSVALLGCCNHSLPPTTVGKRTILKQITSKWRTPLSVRFAVQEKPTILESFRGSSFSCPSRHRYTRTRNTPRSFPRTAQFFRKVLLLDP